MATDFMSMAAKMSDRGDDMSEANLQADGLVEKPAQGAVDWQEMVVPCPEATYRPSQYKPLFRNMSDFNRGVRRYSPTLACLDGTSGRRYVVRSESWTNGGSGYWPR